MRGASFAVPAIATAMPSRTRRFTTSIVAWSSDSYVTSATRAAIASVMFFMATLCRPCRRVARVARVPGLQEHFVKHPVDGLTHTANVSRGYELARRLAVQTLLRAVVPEQAFVAIAVYRFEELGKTHGRKVDI